MKKKITVFLVFSFFIGLGGLFAQRTFADKKRGSSEDGHVKVEKLKPSLLQKKVQEKINKKTQQQSISNFIFSKPFTFTKNSEFKPIKKVLSKSGRTVFNSATIGSKENKSTVNEISINYLKTLVPQLKINSVTDELQLKESHVDKNGKTHLKYQQIFNGVKVFGGESYIHISKNKDKVSYTGKIYPSIEIQTSNPRIDASYCFEIIENDLNTSIVKTKKSVNQITIPGPESELVWYNHQQSLVLVWHITAFENYLDRWEYFINAESGAIVAKYYHTCTLTHEHFEGHEHNNKSIPSSAKSLPPTSDNLTDLNGVQRQINGYTEGTETYMFDTTKSMFNAAQTQVPDNLVGAIVTLDFNNQPYDTENPSFFYVSEGNGNYTNPIAVSAHYNASVSYDYFENTFNRNSLNGEGGTIYSIINVADTDGGGFDNAFWNGSFMAYGNGDFAFKPVAGALDVGGHEMGHGVIGTTANLIYQDQSGAINESFADIFGAMIDRDDWLIGEDIVTNQYFTSGAMRDMQNPNNGGNVLGDPGWQPAHMDEIYTGTQDNGGVHINSGIANRAYYLVATAIGKDKAEQIYYKALVDYLTASSQFIDLRIAVINAATDLHGTGSVEVQTVMDAYDAVGITDGNGDGGTDTNDDLPSLNGNEFILSVDVNSDDPNTLYISDTNGENFVPVSQAGVFRKPSVADDGSIALYVTEDNTVNGIILEENNISEEVVSDQPIWSQVALSKDGTKFSAITNDDTNIIYVFDLVSGEFQEYTLFNPTSADGVSTGDVLYPDAMEWDYSGEYIMYDAYNALDNPFGVSIDYWDVGFIKVWDYTTNTFGDGSIQKLFSSLPEGVSIGNPSFSKTSGKIVAFDYFNFQSDEYEVLAANIETGELNTIFVNQKLGFPNYASDDSKLIFDAYATDDSELIAVINLNTDKITAQGNASGLIGQAKWGTWYTQGERETEEPPSDSSNSILSFSFNNLTPPVNATISGNQISAIVPEDTDLSALVATFTISEGAVATVNGITQQSGITENNFTNAVTYTITAANNAAQNYTVLISLDSNTNDPNDLDGDGVLNDFDKCPNTPTGTPVDTDGCPTNTSSENNFTVQITNSSCVGLSNGVVQISAVNSANYTVLFTGNGINESVNFLETATIENLPPGQYSACISQVGESAETCFEVQLSEPEALGVDSITDLDRKSVTLNLSGSSRYFIQLNNQIFETAENSITLPLDADKNKLTVSTTKDCQGSYEELIILGSNSYVYPNPVEGEELFIAFPSLNQGEQLILTVFSVNGQLVKSEQITVVGGKAQTNISELSKGTYIIKMEAKNTTITKKILRK
jgi:Zn-dependent metalloprotease